MCEAVAELVKIAESLPPDRRREVADFALFLLQKTELEQGPDEDEAWEQTLAKPGGYPKLEAYAREAMAEGREPMDLGKL